MIRHMSSWSAEVIIWVALGSITVLAKVKYDNKNYSFFYLNKCNPSTNPKLQQFYCGKYDSNHSTDWLTYSGIL